MKKITMSLLAIFAFGVQAHAQKPDTNIRLKTGLNISTITNEPSSKTKAGFNIGVAAEFFVTEKFALQPELQYSTQGSKFDKSLGEYFGLYDADIQFKMNYINVPIMAKYYVAEGLSLQAGPQLGFNVKSEIEITANGITVTQDNKDLVNTVDFGLNLGVAYDLSFGLFFDARYNLGLTKINKVGDDTKQSVFQLSVGYKF
ncbi:MULTISPECIES: porin family protein [unclassified Myroides]|uniref:porin family protein n=1 Tax=unclassified Myroides TaxID=2642485 RepID=UPI0015FDD311|nr:MULTISPECIES: porin family protein [unclassified Myroides]MBB1149608.1 PorT family protein [Myroides sp. NP-2]MDM1407080.1 PorT family protein [Myroides sp. DF42-4-2]